MKKNIFRLYLVFVTLCLITISSCNKIRSPELLETKTFLELAFKKTGSIESVIPSGDDVAFLGTGTDQYQTVTLTYKERSIAVTRGIEWKITYSKNPLPPGITQKATEEGYEFAVNRATFVYEEDFDIKIVVLRKTTVLAESTIKVKAKTLPNVENILIRRKTGQENTKVKKDATIDLTTIFDIVVSPIGASSEVVWKVDSPTLGTVDDKGVLTALGIGTINITVSPIAIPTITSLASPLVLDANIKTLQIKDITFDVETLSTDELLVAWIIYTPVGGTKTTENLGQVKLRENGLVVSPDPIMVSEVKLIENNTFFIISVEKPTIKTDERVIKAIAQPSNEQLLSGLVSVDEKTYTLNFLGNTNFSNPNTNGTSSSFILYSPTDDVIGAVVNDESGIWFTKDADATANGLQAGRALNLPTLSTTGKWMYEAWLVVSPTLKISLGKFFDPNKADKNAFYYSNTAKAPSFPGEDLLVNRSGGAGTLSPNPFPVDARGKKVVITIEPATDLASNDLNPYFLSILEGDVNNLTGPTVNHSLTSKIPSGKVQVQ